MKNQKKTSEGGIFILIWAAISVVFGAIFSAINKTGQGTRDIIFCSLFFGIFLAFFICLFWRVIRTKKKLRNQRQNNSVSGNGTVRPKSPVVTSVNVVRQEVPQKTLNDMRMAYTGQQAVNDMRIIDESLKIMETTSDIDTFLSRFETAMRYALTLEQSKKAGVPIALADGFSQSLANAKNEALKGVLYRSFQKELEEISKLKTESGKRNRINKYQEKLKGMYETEIQFNADEAYNDIMQKLEYLKKG